MPVVFIRKKKKILFSFFFLVESCFSMKLLLLSRREGMLKELLIGVYAPREILSRDSFSAFSIFLFSVFGVFSGRASGFIPI